MVSLVSLSQKGSRQGDPMSHFLFALSMEYLLRCVNELEENDRFKFHPRCKRNKITHLMLVDDLLLFSHGDMESVKQLMKQEQNYTFNVCSYSLMGMWNQLSNLCSNFRGFL